MVDEWGGLADLLAKLVEKHASDLGIDNMPDMEIKSNNGKGKRESRKTERIRIFSCGEC